MNWFDKLERKFGRWAIRGLMTYIVALNGLVYLLSYIDPSGRFIHSLTLDPQMVLAGDYWRLITYIVIPPAASPLFIIFALYFYYLIGNTLEQEWGSFKFNLFYLLGMAGTTLGAFISGGETTSTFLNLSLFLAFAHLFPNFELLLFFVLPVKIKYLGWFQWAFIGFTVLTAPFPAKLAALASVVNFLIFFGPKLTSQARLNNRSYHRRQQFRTNNASSKEAFHKCTICGRTELDDPKLEFRYCAQCAGDHEYCMEHLQTHEHIKE